MYQQNKTHHTSHRFDFAYMGSMKEVAGLETFTTDFGVEFGLLTCADAFNPHIFPEYVKAGKTHAVTRIIL
jgi:predicted amidohydrolase